MNPILQQRGDIGIYDRSAGRPCVTEAWLVSVICALPVKLKMMLLVSPPSEAASSPSGYLGVKRNGLASAAFGERQTASS